ncbi:MAG TPA: zinc-binding dehydrogenase [Trueperaceae bacterium]|nr:zinc-binding dehydrogenase [Trueperaceae bacterium]
MQAVRKLAGGKGHVAVVDVAEPEIRPGHVIVEVAAAGICGTDVHIVDGEFATEPPVTMGHELAGTVRELGEGVHGWQVGDRVTSETYFSTCGRCIHCRRGRPNLCTERKSIGSKRDGAFAPYLLVPAVNLHRVPEALSLERAALTEPLACTVHGVIDTAGVRAGDRVAITGPGPIGLLALQLAVAAGARAVMLGTAQDAGRLQLALELGAEAVLDVGEVDDVEAWFADATGSEGADLVVECSGAGPAVNSLLSVVRKGGRYAQMGLFGKGVQIDQDIVCYKELVVTGTNASVPTAWPRALDLLAGGQVDASKLITHRFALESWEQALRTVRAKEGVKVVLTP